MASTPMCVEQTETLRMTNSPEKGEAGTKGDASVPIKVGYLTIATEGWGQAVSALDRDQRGISLTDK